jgi:hypothetical protein
MNFKRITPISNLKIWFLSSIISSIFTTGLFVISQFFGLFEFIVTPAGSDLKWQNIASGAFVFPLIATVLYCLLQFVTVKHITMLRRIGYGFLACSFLLPLQLEDVTIFEKILLLVIHIIIAVVFIEWVSAFHSKPISKLSTPQVVLDKKQISL